MGTGEFLHSAPYEPEFEDYARQLSQRLTTAIQVTSQPGWSWYESYLTYCNAVIPHSLLVASRITEDESLATIGQETLEWLWNIQVDENGLFEPIGSTRAFLRGEKRPQFDQQPVEVSTMISACIEAWKITREEKWRERANQAFSWFEGMNWLGQTMIDTETGACFDGLQQFSINQNQGAESTVSFLMSCAEMRVLNNVKSSHLELRQVG